MMNFLVETHMHTKPVSLCAQSTGAEMARAYKAAGYSAVFVTDHFFNGNCYVPRDQGWEKRVEMFTRGYLEAKAEGEKIGLSVFFAWETGAMPSEFLTYGIDVDYLLAHPDIAEWSAKEYIERIHAAGGFISQAHPFREAGFLYGLHLYPEAGVCESFNAHNRPAFNRRAAAYALEYGLLQTCGSDCHDAANVGKTGMLFPAPIRDSRDFIEAVKTGQCELSIA